MTMVGANSLPKNKAGVGKRRLKTTTQFPPPENKSVLNSPDFMPVLPGANYIEHRVSKMDTLAGVAIKYGVEVADIKRTNGLVTDLQMFALRSLHIPLPGRHPPSSTLSNDSATPREQSTEQTQTRRAHIEILNSIESTKSKDTSSKVSPAMVSLQGYYGLRSLDDNNEQDHLELTAEARVSEAERMNEKIVRRRQKYEVDSLTTALLLKEDGSSRSSIKPGNILGLRSKCPSRTSIAADVDSGRPNLIPMGVALKPDIFSGFRKSMSTPSFLDSDTSFIWPTSKWTLNLKADLQALSAAAITRPLLDLTGRLKTALD